MIVSASSKPEIGVHTAALSTEAQFVCACAMESTYMQLCSLRDLTQREEISGYERMLTGPVDMQMRLAERVATALHALHSIHVIHAAICPDALCVSPHADASTGCPPATPPTSGNPAPSSLPSAQASTKSRSGSFRVRSFKGKSTGTHTEIPPQDIRVMLADFASACALAPPDYSIPNSHIRDPLQAMAARYSPPERRKEGGSLNTQSDMYSWAATMYHLMTCQHPCVTESACIKGVPSSILTGGDKMDNIERGSGVPREVCLKSMLPFLQEFEGIKQSSRELWDDLFAHYFLLKKMKANYQLTGNI